MRLVFGKSGHYVNSETIRLWHVDRYEVDTRLHQARNEMNVRRQAVQFGDEKRGAEPVAFGDGGQ